MVDCHAMHMAAAGMLLRLARLAAHVVLLDGGVAAADIQVVVLTG